MTPYAIPVVRAVAAREHSKVIWACGAQMGKTAGILDIVGCEFDTSPGPTLFTAPTRLSISDMIEPRVQWLIDNTPLARITATGQKNKKLKKLIGGVPLRFAFAGSSAMLKSDPFRLAVTDEADELVANLNGQGDPITLIDQRGQTYPDFVQFVTSTPSTGPCEVTRDEASGLEFWAEMDGEEISSTIWRLWLAGSRHHWVWRCPHCGEWFVPRLRHLKWDVPTDEHGNELRPDPDLARRSAHIECPNNGCIIEEADKEAMNASGLYVAPGQRIRRGKVVGTTHATTLSFWTSGLASPFRTFGDRAYEYVTALRSGQPGQIQTVTNAAFGELYAPGGSSVPEWDALKRLIDQSQFYVLGQRPETVRALTLAVDVQRDRLIYGVRGWGSLGTSWLVDIGELPGDTRDLETWEKLDDIVLGVWDGMPIRAGAVDSGFRPGGVKEVPEHRVYSYCSRFPTVLHPSKGWLKRNTPVDAHKIEPMIDWRGKKKKVGLDLLRIDTDYFKRWVHERFAWAPDENGAFLLPHDVPERYLRQLVSEGRVVTPSGTPEWVRRSRDNHYFDIEAMQGAVAMYTGVMRLPERGQADRKLDGRQEARAAAMAGKEKPQTRAGRWAQRLNK